MARWLLFSTGALLVFLAGAPLLAQTAPPPRVGSIVSVSTNDRTDNEVSLTINPVNPLNLLAGWNTWSDDREGVGYSYSFDGGRTWSRQALLPGVVAGDEPDDGAGFQVAGDPAFLFGPDGTAYAVLQAFNVTPPFDSRLLVAISSDGGRSWPRRLVAFRGAGEDEGRGAPDRAAVAIDSNPFSPWFGTLYVAFGSEQAEPDSASVLLVSLRPGAPAFSAPVAVTRLAAGFTQAVVPFAGPDGRLYVTFVARESESGGSAVFVAESADAGRSFSPSYLLARMRDPVDGGLPNSGYRVASFPVGAFDLARRRLVVAWNDRVDGVSSMLAATASPADLSKWSTPARVTATSTGEQFFPALSAASDGRLDLLFYDRSRDPGNRLNFVTYAWSGDGGQTWNSLNVTRAAFDGDAQTTPGGSSFIGDYIGIASTPAAAYLAWTGNGPSNPCICNQDIFFTTLSHGSR
jgi:hypothetical protein